MSEQALLLTGLPTESKQQEEFSREYNKALRALTEQKPTDTHHSDTWHNTLIWWNMIADLFECNWWRVSWFWLSALLLHSARSNTHFHQWHTAFNSFSHLLSDKYLSFHKHLWHYLPTCITAVLLSLLLQSSLPVHPSKPLLWKLWKLGKYLW